MNRDCGYYERLMGRMADGRLSAAEARALETHLRACPECERLYGAYAAQTLLREDTAEAPEALARDVMARIRAGESGPVPVPAERRHARRWVSLAAAACLALIIAGTALAALRGRLSVGTDMTEAVYEAAARDAAPAEAPMEGYDNGADGVPFADEAESAAEEPAAGEAAMAAIPESAEKADAVYGAAEEANDEAAGRAAVSAAEAATAPSYVPAGREADFEALITGGGPAEADGETLRVLAAVEYDGVLYEFLTDESETALFWRKPGGELTCSPGAPADLRDILEADSGTVEACYEDPDNPLAEQSYEVGPPNHE